MSTIGCNVHGRAPDEMRADGRCPECRPSAADKLLSDLALVVGAEPNALDAHGAQFGYQIIEAVRRALPAIEVEAAAPALPAGPELRVADAALDVRAALGALLNAAERVGAVSHYTKIGRAAYDKTRWLTEYDPAALIAGEAALPAGLPDVERPLTRERLGPPHLTDATIDAMASALRKTFPIYSDDEAGVDEDADAVSVLDALVNDGFIIAALEGSATLPHWPYRVTSASEDPIP